MLFAISDRLLVRTTRLLKKINVATKNGIVTSEMIVNSGLIKNMIIRISSKKSVEDSMDIPISIMF